MEVEDHSDEDNSENMMQQKSLQRTTDLLKRLIQQDQDKTLVYYAWAYGKFCIIEYYFYTSISVTRAVIILSVSRMFFFV